MLNKELLMAGSESLEPVLSIYISPDALFMPRVTVMLSSGDPLNVSNTGETTLKFSEIDLNARIYIRYNEGTLLSTSNLTAYRSLPPREGISRVPSVMTDTFYITDKTQSASISLV
jgi:hypothetical protein